MHSPVKGHLDCSVLFAVWMLALGCIPRNGLFTCLCMRIFSFAKPLSKLVFPTGTQQSIRLLIVPPLRAAPSPHLVLSDLNFSPQFNGCEMVLSMCF